MIYDGYFHEKDTLEDIERDNRAEMISYLVGTLTRQSSIDWLEKIISVHDRIPSLCRKLHKYILFQSDARLHEKRDVVRRN